MTETQEKPNAHTPVPWKVVIEDAYTPRDATRVSIVGPWQHGNESNEGTIAELWPTSKDEDITDARFIVRACNAHDDLLAAAHALRDWAETMGEWEAACWTQLDAAIAKAEAEA